MQTFESMAVHSTFFIMSKNLRCVGLSSTEQWRIGKLAHGKWIPICSMGWKSGLEICSMFLWDGAIPAFGFTWRNMMEVERFSVNFRWNQPIVFCFHFFRWFKLAHIYNQIRSLHNGGNQGIDEHNFKGNRFHVKLRIFRPYSNRIQKFNSRSISRKLMKLYA